MRRGTAIALALTIIVAVAGAWLTGYAEKKLPKPGITSFARKQMGRPTSHVIISLRGRPKTMAQEVWTASKARVLTVNYNLDVRWEIPTFSMISGKIPSRNVPAVSRLDWVKAVSKDWLAELSAPREKGLKGLTLDEVGERVGFDELWRKRGRGEGMRVAVVDSGKPSPEVVEVAESYTVLEDKKDRYGHSAAVCWVYSKLAPEAEIVTYKALGARGLGRISDVIKALERIANLPEGEKPDLVNLSLGVPPAVVSPLSIAADTLDSRFEIPVICAAGNAGPASPSVMQPATGSETVCVGALNAKGEVATFSSRGRAVDTATYGVVYSYWGGEGIEKVVGTSIASPIWGAAYLDWLSGIKGSNIDDRRMAALSSVDIGPEGWDPASGYGKLSGERLAGTSPVLEKPWYQKYAPMFALVVLFVLLVAWLIRRR